MSNSVTIADKYKYIEAHLRLNYPCHSQTVEHAVQITTKVAFFYQQILF